MGKFGSYLILFFSLLDASVEHIQGYSETNYLQLSVLPSQLYYNRLAISGTPIVIARREIFDIRTQLMAEDNEGHDNEELISGLEEGDLKPNFYEGGFKTWECALDLAKLVSSEDSNIQPSNSQRDAHFIEVRIFLH